ncbi:MAG: hypothetical protein AAF191_21340 [Verrucomicrobiota bacterium]
MSDRSANPLPQIISELSETCSGLGAYAPQLGEEECQHVQEACVKARAQMESLLPRLEEESDETRLMRHDLKNHISIVRGFSDLMLMEAVEGSSEQVLLSSILRTSDALTAQLDLHKPAGNADHQGLFA